MARDKWPSGKDHPMFGKKQSGESRKKMSESHKGVPLSKEHIKNRTDARVKNGYRHSVETKARISATEKGKIVSAEAIAKMIKAKKGKRCSPGTEFNSEILKARYQDPAYVEKMAKAWNIKPNKAEVRMLELLNELYPGEWKYTGDFSFTINGKCPDFVNCNGKKLIIEYFGDHWHQGHDPDKRAAEFRPFGYETLVVWGSEMTDMKNVISKIRSFVDENTVPKEVSYGRR
jgi:very-short-patch-repair endonuclease